MPLKVTQSHLTEPAWPSARPSCAEVSTDLSLPQPWVTPRILPHFPAYKMKTPISESSAGKGGCGQRWQNSHLCERWQRKIINWRSQLNCNRIYSKLLHQLHLWPGWRPMNSMNLIWNIAIQCTMLASFLSFFFFFWFCDLGLKMEAVFEKL